MMCLTETYILFEFPFQTFGWNGKPEARSSITRAREHHRCLGIL